MHIFNAYLSTEIYCYYKQKNNKLTITIFYLLKKKQIDRWIVYIA